VRFRHASSASVVLTRAICARSVGEVRVRGLVDARQQVLRVVELAAAQRAEPGVDGGARVDERVVRRLRLHLLQDVDHRPPRLSAAGF